MPRTSAITRPNFKSEKEEADWYHTPEGRTFMQRSLEKASREGRLRFVNRTTGKSPTVAEVKEVLELARQALLRPVSLRLPQGDLDKAKRIARATGKGYQTVLKEIIHKGLLQR